MADAPVVKLAARRGAHASARRADLEGVGLVLLTSVQFGAVVVLGKVVTSSGLPVPTYLSARFGVAALLLAAALVATGQPLAAAPGEGWKLAGLGALGYAVEAAFFFLALQHGTAASVTLLFFTYPVMVSAVAAALGRGLPGWLLGGALACSVGGASLVVLGGGGVDVKPAGVGFALASAATFSLYLVGADATLKGTPSLAGAMWVSASASLALAAVAALTAWGEVPRGWGQWGPVLGTGAFTAGAFVCLFAGMRRLGVVRTSVLSASEPLSAALLAALFLGEAVGPGTAGGGALIVAGAVGASLARPREPAEPPVP
ncbi:MAG TPA: DMT family transporter [Actinomycetota bacterium]|nr:DMT family transporter [Actinomycetota bacterium]